MKKAIALALSILAITLLGGCTTTAMLSAPTAVNAQQNIYSFKIDVSTFGYGQKKDERATQEFNKFMQENGYSSYKVLDRQYELVPMTGFKYTVQFYK